MQPERKWPGAGGAATGPGVSKRALGQLPHIATAQAGQLMPAMLALHLGVDWLSGWAAGRGAP